MNKRIDEEQNVSSRERCAARMKQEAGTKSAAMPNKAQKKQRPPRHHHSAVSAAPPSVTMHYVLEFSCLLLVRREGVQRSGPHSPSTRRRTWLSNHSAPWLQVGFQPMQQKRLVGGRLDSRDKERRSRPVSAHLAVVCTPSRCLLLCALLAICLPRLAALGLFV